MTTQKLLDRYNKLLIIQNYIEMGTAHKVTHEEETSIQMMKNKQQIQLLQNDSIRLIEGSIEDEYQILSPALVVNDFYQLRKSIYKKTNISKTIFIINKYKVRTQQRQLLEEQINKLKNIDNPYLLKIYQLYHDRHRFYIICQFCHGLSLTEILAEEGCVSQRKAALILFQILNVLAECHKNGIMHTDLKLQNIAFNSKEEEVIKITDFSISRIFRIEDIVAQCYGKVFLLAPQTLIGGPVIKSDIWSCGVILYILLSGHVPIMGASIKTLRQKLSYCNYLGILDNPNFSHDKFKYISKEAKKLIKWMLNQNPELRPTAEQCVKHDWFAKYYRPTRISDSKLKRILNEALYFNVPIYQIEPPSKLLQATWNLYVNAFISFNQKQEILHAFMRLDRSNKNYLTDEDIKLGFMNFYEEEKATSLTNFVYHRHRDRIFRFSEFLAMCTNRKFLINNQNTKNLFLTIDDNGNGTIQLNELKAVLGDSKQIGLEVLQELMKEADQHSNVEFSLEQFRNLMNQLKNYDSTLLNSVL